MIYPPMIGPEIGASVAVMAQMASAVPAPPVPNVASSIDCDTGGAQLAAAPRSGTAYATQAFAAPATEAEARVRAIIAAHR